MTRLLWAAMFAVLSSLTPAAHPTPPRPLWGWDPSPLLAAARERLLADYLDLNERAAARSHAAGLAYGVDIPFWWRSADPTDRLLDIADNVGIMDYRNQAGGPDGIVAHAVDTLERTDQIAKARVFVGVDTGGAAAGTPSKGTFAGTSSRDMNPGLGSGGGA